MKEYQPGDGIFLWNKNSDPFMLFSAYIKITEPKDCDMCKGLSLQEVLTKSKIHRVEIPASVFSGEESIIDYINEHSYGHVCPEHIKKIKKESEFFHE